MVHELKDGDLINFGCDINASFHLIASQEKIEQAPVKSSGQIRVDMTENEANYSRDTLHTKSTLILNNSPSQAISFDNGTQEESSLDPLTNLPNRSIFNEYLSNAINNAQKSNQMLVESYGSGSIEV